MEDGTKDVQNATATGTIPEEEKEKMKNMSRAKLVEKIEEKVKEIAKLDKEVKRVKKELDEKGNGEEEKEVTEQKEKIEKLESENIDLENENLILNEDVKNLTTKNNDLEQEITELNETTSSLNKKLKDANTTNSDLKEEIKELNNQVTTITNDKSTLEGEKKDLNKKLKELETKESQLRNSNDLQLKDLITSKDQIKQYKVQIEDLMKRLRNKPATTNDDTEDSAEALFIVDAEWDHDKLSIMKKGAKWDWISIKSVRVLRDRIEDLIETQKLYKYDKVVILLGHGDIREGVEGFDLFNLMKKIVKVLDEMELQVTICQLPPLMGTLGTDVQIFNSCLDNLENIEIISLEKATERVAYSKIVSDEGVVSEWGLNMIKDCINEQLTKPIIRKNKENRKPPTHPAPKVITEKDKNKKSYKDALEENIAESDSPASEQELEEDSESDLERDGKGYMKINPDHAGLIIGQMGSTIRAIQAKSRTKISLDYKTVDGELTKVAIIYGTEEGIENAKKRIRQLVAKEEKKNKSLKRPPSADSKVQFKKGKR